MLWLLEVGDHLDDDAIPGVAGGVETPMEKLGDADDEPDQGD